MSRRPLPVLPTANAKCGEPASGHPHGPSCDWCGAPNPRPRSPYCTKVCAQAANRWRRRVDRTRTACFECGEPFTPQRSSGVFCKDACRARHWRRRDGWQREAVTGTHNGAVSTPDGPP